MGADELGVFVAGCSATNAEQCGSPVGVRISHLICRRGPNQPVIPSEAPRLEDRIQEERRCARWNEE
jgi:hypothetical protein